MTIRHAVALTLFGWYLLTPPQAWRNGKPLVGVNVDAPLRMWKISEAFDRAADCERVRSDGIERGHKFLANTPPGAAHQPITTSEAHAKWTSGFSWITALCIATDDPRLTVDPRGPKGK